MEIQQLDGRVYVSAQDFKILISSLEKLASSCGLKLPSGKSHEKVFDLFRSTSLSLRWNFSFRPSPPSCESQSPSSSAEDSKVVDGTVYDPPYKPEHVSIVTPTLNVGAHDLTWLIKFWNMNYLPPHKVRSVSRWPRFGITRATRSGQLSFDKVMTEFFLRIDVTLICIKHVPLDVDDPA
ncbi:hypothetical protein H0E87_010730 [Populus deltoides]|uniref:Uncharacterized protein n=1 Tax=Populus deltoides TaxID=3696 RepID=A0A8T2YUG4_POPDE|nr:hypothetical protein H0E87_010730 [Populus deltoides]